MDATAAYCLAVPAGGRLEDQAEAVFGLVWRVDFTPPGFAVLDAGPAVDSHALRAGMVALVDRLGEVGVRRGRGRLAYRSASRFDQQVTTKFHLDGGSDQSVLVLGYEPSAVRSRLLLADYSRAAFDLGVTPRKFLRDHNPMFRAGDGLLARYVTEVPPPAVGHSRVVLVNNSSLPFADGRTNTLGVLHKAVVVPDAAERRVVNSILLGVGGEDTVGPDRRREFVATDDISRRDD